jgi:DNA-directed RNA polymerase specialized sigma24 family protein
MLYWSVILLIELYMKLSEPSREWQLKRHERILQDDVTAFAELSEIALPHLVLFLQQQFPQQDAHHQEMIAIDTLMAYHARPTSYNPEKLGLLAYLRMAARGDMLNIIDKQARRQKKLSDLDDPSVQKQLPTQGILTDSGNLKEWLQTHTDLSRTELLKQLSNELDESDQEILLLMLEEERDHKPYAEILDIGHFPVVEQRKIVKRNKDRIQKKIERFGIRARR